MYAFERLEKKKEKEKKEETQGKKTEHESLAERFFFLHQVSANVRADITDRIDMCRWCALVVLVIPCGS